MIKAMLLFLFLVLQSQPIVAQTIQETKYGDLESNLSILNLFEEQSIEVNKMYQSAYGILAQNRETTFVDVSKDKVFQLICNNNGITHLGGPMLGAITPEGARIWIRSLKPAEINVYVIIDGIEKMYGPVCSTDSSDLTAVINVTGLKPSTRYPYRVTVDGKPIRISENAAIVTAPESMTSGKVRIAFGSCFHRWGLGNRKQANLIRSRNPAVMLLLGDIAVQDREINLGMHRADYLMRDLFPGWQDLVATVPVYATWDDHDYYNDDRAGFREGFSERDKMEICDVFRQAWNNPSYGFGDERGGVFLRTRVGPCDIIMVDNRYFRSGKEGSFLGDEQMEWLKKQLLECKGPFIIISCGTMWSDYVQNGKDSWGKYDPEGREDIFNLIEENGIGGVILISGDRHGARGFRIPRSSGFEFYEFEVASLGGRKGPPVRNCDWTTQLFGISDRYAFGEFSIDATLPDPEVTSRLIGDDGTVIYELVLKRSTLMPITK